jgi:hypothetical protein
LPGRCLADLARQHGLAVPAEMTYVEAMLIAGVHVVMSCFTIKSKGGKGQLGYSEHCVALPRDTARLVNAIPILPADLEAIIVRPADARSPAADASNGFFSPDCRFVTM